MSTFQENILAQTPVKRYFADYDHGAGATAKHQRDYSRANTGGGRAAEIAKALTPATIPADDLEVLTKLYFKKYDDCGRKHTSLLRAIKFFKETQEKPKLAPRLLAFLKRK